MAFKFDKEKRNKFALEEKIVAQPDGLVKRSGKHLDTTMTPKKGLTNSPPPVKPISNSILVDTPDKDEKKSKQGSILRR
jgi:hypothetical protein